MPTHPAAEPTPFRPRRRFVRALRAILLLLILAYAGVALWLMSQETTIVFRAGAPLGPARPSFPYEQIDLPRADGARQIAWVMRHPESDVWVLYLHGNAATIANGSNIARYRELRALGLNLLAPEYRGYAGLPGSPTEEGLADDGRAAYAYLTGDLGVRPDRIVVYGWSLGSAVAVHVASTRPVGGIILEGAPASLVEIGREYYPLLPIRLMMRNPFDSIDRIDRVRAPLLFLHSPSDSIVPISQGRRLFAAAPEPKRFVEVSGGHVYANERDAAVFFGSIRAFLDEHGLLRQSRHARQAAAR